MMPKKLYEALRWIIAILIPAFEVLLTTLTNIWEWNIPAEAINNTMSAIALFLGVIFGISKLTYDNSNKTAQKGK